ncbi:MAG: hypothetical protein M5U34_16235 [Chloroflexi bacterium]|nr:hypothetical protein [Chloroflexota bacterium]
MNDQMVAQVLDKTRSIFPKTIVAQEGLELTLPLTGDLPDIAP